jgi:hypothetical protein
MKMIHCAELTWPEVEHIPRHWSILVPLSLERYDIICVTQSLSCLLFRMDFDTHKVHPWIDGGSIIANPLWRDDTTSGIYGDATRGIAAWGRLRLGAALPQKLAIIKESQHQHDHQTKTGSEKSSTEYHNQWRDSYVGRSKTNQGRSHPMAAGDPSAARAWF